MEKNIKNKQKGVESEFLIFGKSEDEERKYRGKEGNSGEINERIEKWKEKNHVKLGRVVNLALTLERM